MTDTPTPAAALEADVTDVHGYPFTFGGVTFRAKPQFDARCLIAIQKGEVYRGLVLLMGAKQADAFLALETDEGLSMTRLEEIIKGAAEYKGSTVGESAASTSFS